MLAGENIRLKKFAPSIRGRTFSFHERNKANAIIIIIELTDALISRIVMPNAKPWPQGRAP